MNREDIELQEFDVLPFMKKYFHAPCGGYFKATSFVLQSNPVQYQLICDKCSEQIASDTNPNAVFWKDSEGNVFG